MSDKVAREEKQIPSSNKASSEMSSPFHHDRTRIQTHIAPPCGSPPQLVQVLES